MQQQQQQQQRQQQRQQQQQARRRPLVHVLAVLGLAVAAAHAVREGRERAALLDAEASRLEASLPPRAREALLARGAEAGAESLRPLLKRVARGNEEAAGELQRALDEAKGERETVASEQSRVTAKATEALEALLERVDEATAAAIRKRVGLQASATPAEVLQALGALSEADRHEIEAMLGALRQQPPTEWARTHQDEVRQREYDADTLRWTRRIEAAEEAVGEAAEGVVRAFLEAAYVDAGAAGRTRRQLAERAALLKGEKAATLRKLMEELASAALLPPERRRAFADDLLAGGELQFEIPEDWKPPEEGL